MFGAMMLKGVLEEVGRLENATKKQLHSDYCGIRGMVLN
jgi:hypothetical protein